MNHKPAVRTSYKTELNKKKVNFLFKVVNIISGDSNQNKNQYQYQNKSKNQNKITNHNNNKNRTDLKPNDGLRIPADDFEREVHSDGGAIMLRKKLKKIFYGTKLVLFIKSLPYNVDKKLNWFCLLNLCHIMLIKKLKNEVCKLNLCHIMLKKEKQFFKFKTYIETLL